MSDIDEIPEPRFEWLDEGGSTAVFWAVFAVAFMVGVALLAGILFLLLGG